MRGSLCECDGAPASARDGLVSRSPAEDAGPLSRSSVAEEIDKLAAVFIGIGDKHCRESNER
jgi:hypothetical protein